MIFMKLGSVIGGLFRTVRWRPSTQIFGAILVVAALCVLIWCFRAVLDQHEGTAAWVQAAGAILIIGATAWVAGRSSREAAERERNAKFQLQMSIAALARFCVEAVDTFLGAYPQKVSLDRDEYFSRHAYVPSDFELPMDGLAALPLHQIDDAALIIAVLNLRGAMARIKQHLDDVLRNKLKPSPEFVRNQRTPLFNAFASVLRIVKGHAAEAEISRLASHM